MTFNYCRRVNAGLPCKLIIGCWQGRLDVVEFLSENFGAEELQRAFEPPPGSKLERLVGLIERARAGRDQPDDG